MKKLLFCMAGALSLLFAGCSDDPKEPDPTPPVELSLAVMPSSVEFPADGGTETVTVTTNAETWEVESDQTWCVATPVDDTTFTITAEANTTADAMPEATVTVTATQAETGLTMTAEIPVTQASTDAALTLAPDTPVAFTGDGGTQEISVETNLEKWKVESDQTWCVVTINGNNSFVISAAMNETGEAKPAATVTVTAGEGNNVIAKAIEVTQEAGFTGIGLSNRETANCYLISAAGDYCFDATVRGNGATTDGLDAPTPLAPAGAKLVWQTSKGMISDIRFANGCIYFTAADIKGNALIAATDADGTIIWSWHIWFPVAQTIGSLPAPTGYKVMNLNLGAMHDSPIDAGSYGLLYQWGRKDPLPASSTQTGTTTTVGAPLYDADGNAVTISQNTTDCNIAFSIANPTVCISNQAQYATTRDWLAESNDALWGNPDGGKQDAENNYPNKGGKSFYDPCPVGWRVPPADVFHNFTASGGYAWVIDDFNVADITGDDLITIDDYMYGWCFNFNENISSYFPAASRYDGTYAMLMGSMSGLWGSYWGNSPNDTDQYEGGAFCVLSFATKDMYGNDALSVSPTGGAARADAYSVRCIQE